jgi:hypothetical protein
MRQQCGLQAQGELRRPTQSSVLEVSRDSRLHRQLSPSSLMAAAVRDTDQVQRFQILDVAAYPERRPLRGAHLRRPRQTAQLRLALPAPQRGCARHAGLGRERFGPGSLHIEREPREIWLLGRDDPGPPASVSPSTWPNCGTRFRGASRRSTRAFFLSRHGRGYDFTAIASR